MDQSMAIMSAQVHFLDTELALIHIPLNLYSFFVQPILQLLLPAYVTQAEALAQLSTGAEHVTSRQPWACDYPFVNVSITPVECSIVCPRQIANELFVPLRDSLGKLAKDSVVISNEDYIVIQVDGEGLEAGQRVVELTSPLAMNGISIFFITTYFSDYILVPKQLRATVISALEDRGFIFEENSEAFVNISSPLLSSSLLAQPPDNIPSENCSPIDNAYERDFMFPSSEAIKPASTSSPFSVLELETRTFALLARRDIHPVVDPSIRLIQCAGRKDTSLRVGAERENKSSTSPSALTKEFHLGLVRCLVRIPRPRFFSVTLTDTEPASLLMEQKLLIEFEDIDDENGGEILLGSKEDILIPITLDLRELPMESTGIICGVAGKLVGNTWPTSQGLDENGAAENGIQPMSGFSTLGPVEMSYLSTARAGTVIIAETDIDKAMKALKV